MTEAEAAAAPDKQYLTELHSGGKTYHVYVYRWVLVTVTLICCEHCSHVWRHSQVQSHPTARRGLAGQMGVE